LAALCAVVRVIVMGTRVKTTRGAPVVRRIDRVESLGHERNHTVPRVVNRWTCIRDAVVFTYPRVLNHTEINNNKIKIKQPSDRQLSL
jgi:hypothetical protein